MEALGTTASAPTLIRTYKKEAEFEIWKKKSDGQYALLKTFPMCRWSGQLGPKLREGDHQVPEGFYTITPGQMNPNSAYYLSFNVGYPNAFDRAWDRTGGTIMVHGICSSAGCYSMTDAQIAEIYAIAREVLQRRPARNSDAVLSLQDDRREPRQAPARSEHRLLEAVEERLRSFRSDEDRTHGARVRQALRFRRARRRRGFAASAVPDAASRRGRRIPGGGEAGEGRRGGGRAGRQGRQADSAGLHGRRAESGFRGQGRRRQRSRGAARAAARNRARQFRQADSGGRQGRQRVGRTAPGAVSRAYAALSKPKVAANSTTVAATPTAADSARRPPRRRSPSSRTAARAG